MIIRFILSAMLVFLILYAYRQKSHTRFVCEFIIIVAALGVVVVWFPSIANAAAEVVGIGRGADLVLYFLATAGLMTAFVIHLRLRAVDNTLTVLARHIALSKPNLPKNLTGGEH